jgi:DNA polymerase (family 10)
VGPRRNKPLERVTEGAISDDSHSHSDSHSPVESNADIADRLTGMAQMLAAKRENQFRVRAYRRAAASIRNLSESLVELVHAGADLTKYAGIGEGIAASIREIVASGTTARLEQLKSEIPAELAGITAYPRLDHQRVLRIYQKLGIGSIDELREKLESGAIEASLGTAMAAHVRQGLEEPDLVLLSRADQASEMVREYLLGPGGARRAELAGDCRRRVEVIGQLVFVVETDDFPALVVAMERFGGRAPLLDSGPDHAEFRIPIGIRVRVQRVVASEWGLALVVNTGSEPHVQQLLQVAGASRPAGIETGRIDTEAGVYASFGLPFIEPELREGRDELQLAASGRLPALVERADLRGDLHAHSTSSDGSDSIEAMAAAAQERGYEYLGITDHSQSLKLAGGVTPELLWRQIRFIDQLNERLSGFRVLKSAEVDILADGALDYPDDLLAALDYTVCSIHSRFTLSRAEQTDRVLRAMDHPAFTILGHATGRKLLHRPGYALDFERIVRHARERGRFFEINSNPSRLDLSAERARVVAEAGIKIAVSTDAHNIRELDLIRYGIDQARRAGLDRDSVLNCASWPTLAKLFGRN